MQRFHATLFPRRNVFCENKRSVDRKSMLHVHWPSEIEKQDNNIHVSNVVNAKCFIIVDVEVNITVLLLLVYWLSENNIFISYHRFYNNG